VVVACGECVQALKSEKIHSNDLVLIIGHVMVLTSYIKCLALRRGIIYSNYINITY
jgi:hypothetical protein